MPALAIAALVISTVLFYVVCGAFAYTIGFAHYQREFPDLAVRAYAADRRFNLIMGLFGPVALPGALFVSKWLRHGLKWR